MICLILMQALKRNKFLQKRGCKASTEKARVESNFFSPLSGADFRMEHRNRIKHVNISSMKSLNKRLFLEKVSQAYRQDHSTIFPKGNVDTLFVSETCSKVYRASKVKNPFSQPLSSETSSVDAVYEKFMCPNYSIRNSIIGRPVSANDRLTSISKTKLPKKITRPKSAILISSSRHYNSDHGAADIFAQKRVRPASAYANFGPSTGMQRFKPKKRPSSALNCRLQRSGSSGTRMQPSRPASAIPQYPGYKYFH